MTTRDAKSAVRFMIASVRWAAIMSEATLPAYDCDHMPTISVCSGAQPDRRDLARDQEGAAGRRLYLVDRDAGGELLQCHALWGDFEEPAIGDDEVDDAARRRRDGAALDEAWAAVARR